MSDFDDVAYYRRKQQMEIAIVNAAYPGPEIIPALIARVFLAAMLTGIVGICLHAPVETQKNAMGIVSACTAIGYLAWERYQRLRYRTRLGVALAKMEETFLTTGKAVLP